MIKKINQEQFVSITFFLLLSIIGLISTGTGDDGDSILHYLYAKYAFNHPENFFNHWAKPLYVMIMSPFALIGFKIVKIVNALFISISLYYSLRIAKLIEIKAIYLVALIFIGSPILYSFSLSGLTEPLFACLLSLCIFFAFSERVLWASIIFSFLPFVRSEGLILMPVFIIYLVNSKNWKYLPYLFSGHVFFGLVGSLIYKNPWWVITKIPYAAARNESYGHGPLDHYLLEFPTSFGYLITLGVIIGVIYSFYRLISFLIGKLNFPKNELWLIYGMFISFTVAHSLFWANGWFNSFGLIRVFLAIIPLFALIGAFVFNPWYEQAIKIGNANVFWGTMLLCTGFNLYYKQNWKERLGLNEDQTAYRSLAQKYGKKLSAYTIYADAVYPYFELGIDYFDPQYSRRTKDLITQDNLPTHTAVIWDYRFSVVEGHLDLEKLRNDKRLHEVDQFTINGRPAIYLFENDTLSVYQSSISKYDFEESELIGIDTTISKSGKRSFKLDKKIEFSPGIKDKVISFKDYQYIRVQMDFQFINALSNKPQLVWSYEDNHGKIMEWKSTGIESQDSKINTWQNYLFDIPIDHNKYRSDYIKIYLWNPTDSPLYIDNLVFSKR